MPDSCGDGEDFVGYGCESCCEDCPECVLLEEYAYVFKGCLEGECGYD